MKTLLKLVVVLIVLVVAAVIAAVLYIDTIAKRGVEKGATYALGVPTTLGSAHVGILAGTFDMKGVDVGNPPGFGTPHFLTLNDGDVAVSFASLREPTVVLPELNLTGIDVNLEKKEGKANYTVILDNLKKLESGKPAEPSKDGKKFIIKQVAIRDVTIHVDLLPIGGSQSRVDVPIKEIILTDVGSGGVGGVGGATIDEVVNIIVKAVFAAAVQAGGGLIPQDIVGDLSGALAQLGDLNKFGMQIGGKPAELLGGVVEKAAEGLSDGIEKGVGEALKGLGDTIGGKKQ